MRSIENSGLGVTAPMLTQPGRYPVAHMLYTGGRCGPGALPARPQDLFRKSIGLQTCEDTGSGMRCQSATPVSTMNGLGRLGGTTIANPLCAGFDQALRNLKILLDEAERISTGSSGNLTDDVPYQQAKAYYDKENSWWAWNRTDPILSGTCTAAILTAERYYNALNNSVKASGGTVGVDLAPPELPNNDHTIATTIKWVAVAGGITVAVGGIIYLVGPFVRSLAKAGARAVR